MMVATCKEGSLVGTVLLVDDEKIVRKLTRFALESRGHEVLEARNGRQAISVAEKHGGPIHVMVCELFLPKVTGLELAEKLRADHSGLHPLLLSRTRGSREMEQRTEAAGYRVIREPFQMPDLLAEVDRGMSLQHGERKPAGRVGETKPIRPAAKRTGTAGR